jgi:putative phosphoribosyl transferase
VSGGKPGASAKERSVRIPVNDVELKGDLAIPGKARGLVLFAHGSGSSRQSPRNRYVAQVLQNRGLATLLFDLLTTEEETDDFVRGHCRFNVKLLSRRLIAGTDWAVQNKDTRNFTRGYFGASTGSAAALIAAAERPGDVSAIVSRGGRPELAGPVLSKVKAPTLLIVGGHDFTVIDLNRDALNNLRVEKQLAIIPGATHLFEEPGALEEVAWLSAEWFLNHPS